MDSPAIAFTGSYPIFHGPVTVNLYFGEGTDSKPTVGLLGVDKTDDLVVAPSSERAFYEHRGKDGVYQITKHPKGRVIIINNEFSGEEGERVGSIKDRHDMIDLWHKIGCDVTLKGDLTAKKMLAEVKDFTASAIKADFYCLIVMSHGEEDDLVIGSKSGRVEVEKLVNLMTESENLKGKPKLIFFQICRGNRVARDGHDGRPYDTSDSTWIMDILQSVLDNGRILGSASDAIDLRQPAKDYISKTPDVLLAFASQPDHKAFRNEKNGSWFIQAIKQVFAEHAASLDVVTMMEKVKDEVQKHTADAPGYDYDQGKEIVDGSDTFGGKRLMLFPGFPNPQKSA